MFRLFKKEKVSKKDFIEEKEGMPIGLMYADVATLTNNITNIDNFALRCIHREYVLGYITKTSTGDKLFTTVMETKVRTFPYFDNVTEAELGLECIEDKNFVINAHSISSFGIKEPTNEVEIYEALSKHSMNFRFLDQDRLEEKKHGKLYERK